MRFSRTAGTKFTEVEIVLHQWNHSCEQEPFFSFREFVRFHADRTQKDIQPLVLREGFTSSAHFLNIDMRHLDGGQFADADWSKVLLLFLAGLQRFTAQINKAKIIVTLYFIIQLYNAPDASAEQPIIFFRIFIRNGHLVQSQIRETGKEAVLLNVKIDRDHINNSMAALFSQL